jgi:hypothetical protein
MKRYKPKQIPFFDVPGWLFAGSLAFSCIVSYTHLLLKQFDIARREAKRRVWVSMIKSSGFELAFDATAAIAGVSGRIMRQERLYIIMACVLGYFFGRKVI